jgi:HD-like signal output (HDOD) protein
MYVAHEVSYSNMGNAYSAGLLHDIGKIVINGLALQQGSGRSGTLETIMRERGCTLIDAEREVYGGDHAQIGRQLGELWALPAELSQAIALHHSTPPENTEHLLPWCVAIANAVAGMVDPDYPVLDRVEAPATTLVDLDRVYATAEQFVGEASRP